MLNETAEIETQVLDHHGLVAAQCMDVRLAERIDMRLVDTGKRIVSYGKACMAMVLNGLGFTNRRLYLTPQFFESKPVAILLGAGIEARHLHDDTLGDTLDAIADYGASKLFAEIAFEIAVEHDLLSGLTHVDTTSFLVHGDYEKYGAKETTVEVASTAKEAQEDTAQETTNKESNPAVIEVTYGHSKDHRPDLKQVVLSLAAAGGSGVPLWMTPCNGNASDKIVLGETIERIEAFRREIDCTKTSRYIADSALYTAGNLQKMVSVLWVSRVPESILEARNLLIKSTADIVWSVEEDGYKMAAFDSRYAGIKQRWLLVFSGQAYQREEKTLQKKLIKQEDALTKSLRQFSSEIFACEKDAQKAFDKQQKAQPLFTLTSTIVAVEQYARAGRPKAGEKKQCIGYRVETTLARNEAAIAALLHTKGRFILATNDLDKNAYPDARILAEYKEQQTVERGFRFLKNPEFMADTLFLKSPKRIEALMMIMTLCLMIYNIAQHKLRQQLKHTGETLLNQIGKPTATPTLRWIFQIMEGIATIRILDHARNLIHQATSNLNDLRKKIIRLFGKTACLIYQVA
jgi:transposase